MEVRLGLLLLGSRPADGGGRLDFRPCRPAVPVDVAADGPRMPHLAGAIGDGVILQAKVAPAAFEAAIRRVAEGAEAAADLPARLDALVRRGATQVLINPVVAGDQVEALLETASAWRRRSAPGRTGG